MGCPKAPSLSSCPCSGAGWQWLCGQLSLQTGWCCPQTLQRVRGFRLTYNPYKGVSCELRQTQSPLAGGVELGWALHPLGAASQHCQSLGGPRALSGTCWAKNTCKSLVGLSQRMAPQPCHAVSLPFQQPQSQTHGNPSYLRGEQRGMAAAGGPFSRARLIPSPTSLWVLSTGLC